ncbi:MAG TPA: tetratricopeptide repeat protein [Candidatus Nitrosotenuis sp.]|jgi:tetratricopeptide (TPR) repeat protein|nr:tetratricopeptide repeat protein [Candidatus Nitrosotenuis sp.]
MAEGPRLCPVCAKPLEEGVLHAACLRCQNLYHAGCWEQITYCVAFGCPGTTADTLEDLERPLEPRVCPNCHRENSPGAELCTGCDMLLVKRPTRTVFTSSAGWQARDARELVVALDQHWESGTRHLYEGDIESWARQNRQVELAQAAKESRQKHSNHSVGLECLISATGLLPPPVLTLSTDRLTAEGPGGEIPLTFEITNTGRGYLWGKVQSLAAWMQVDPTEFAGNRVRVAVTVNLDQVPPSGADSALTVVAAGQTGRIEVVARRIGYAEAVAAYERGDTVAARNLCRRLLEVRPGNADATILLAAAYLEEDNPSQAAAAVRNLAGACQEAPSYIVGRVFRWLQEPETHVPGLDKVAFYEAILPCCEGQLAEEVRKALAAACLEAAKGQVEALTEGGAPLWRQRSSGAASALELLEMAEAYDPSLTEATLLKRQLQGRQRSRKVGVQALLVLAVVAVAAAFAGALLWTRGQMSSLYGRAQQAYQAGNYEQAVQLFKQLEEQSPHYRDSQSLLMLSYLALARQAAEAGKSSRAEAYLTNARDVASSNPELGKALAGALVGWAQELEARGQSGPARVYLEQAAQIDPRNAAVQTALARLKDSTQTYWLAWQLAYQPASRGKMKAELARLGMKVYRGNMGIVLDDFEGDGTPDLLVAGTDTEGRQRRGGFQIYRIGARSLEPVLSREERDFPLFNEAGSYDLAGDGKRQILLVWESGKGDGRARSQILYWDGTRFQEARVPGDYPVSVSDDNNDGRYEIWVPQLVGASVPGERVLISRPYVWDGQTFSPARGDFSRYYRNYIDRLQKEIEANPYQTSDPRHGQYQADREKAIALAKQLMQSR